MEQGDRFAMSVRTDYENVFDTLQGRLVDGRPSFSTEEARLQRADEVRTYAWAYSGRESGLAAVAQSAQDVDSTQLGTLLVAHAVLESAVKEEGNERLRAQLTRERIEARRAETADNPDPRSERARTRFGAAVGLVVAIIALVIANQYGVSSENIFTTPAIQVASILVSALCLGALIVRIQIHEELSFPVMALLLCAGIILVSLSVLFLPVPVILLWLLLSDLRSTAAARPNNASFIPTILRPTRRTRRDLPETRTPYPTLEELPFDPDHVPDIIRRAAQLAQAYRGNSATVIGLIERLKHIDIRKPEMGNIVVINSILQDRYDGRPDNHEVFADPLPDIDWNWFDALASTRPSQRARAASRLFPNRRQSRDDEGNQASSSTAPMTLQEYNELLARQGNAAAAAAVDDAEQSQQERPPYWVAYLALGTVFGLLVALVLSSSMPMLVDVQSELLPLAPSNSLGIGSVLGNLLALVGAGTGFAASRRSAMRLDSDQAQFTSAPLRSALYQSFWVIYSVELLLVFLTAIFVH